MKRCPQCRRDYDDGSLLYCLDDGSVLVQSAAGEWATKILPDTEAKEHSKSRGSDVPSTNTSHSIAVLPFANIRALPENEYFCDGLAEEILNALAKIDSLKVAARTSAFSFRGKDVNVSRIGSELGVDHILEGSVRRSGDRLRITVQLINAHNGYHLWSERYDRTMRDIFDVQDEITISVVDALKLKLLKSEKEIVLKRYTENPDAFEDYLKGIYYRWKLDPEEFRKCGHYFHRAIDIDPNFALAYFGLASYYGYGTAFGLLEMPPEDGWERAESAIKKAGELDPTLPELLIENAMKLVHYRKWDEAGRAIERAAAMSPSFGELHHLHSFYLLAAGRLDEAVAEAKYVLSIDPMSVNFRRFLGMCLHFANRLDEAILEYQATLELDSGDPSLREMLAAAYLRKGDLEHGAEEMRASLANDADLVAIFDEAFAAGGLRSAGVAVAKMKLERMNAAHSQGHFILAIWFAREYIIAGDIENAFVWLDRAADERNVFPLLFGSDPFYDELRKDPRFKLLLKRIGVPRSR